MNHSAIINCGACGHDGQAVTLGIADVVVCQGCGAKIALAGVAAPAAVDPEDRAEQLAAELGPNIVAVMRDVALTPLMPQVAAALAKLPTEQAECLLASAIWYLADRNTPVSLDRIDKLVELSAAGAEFDATQLWPIGPRAEA